MIRVVIVPRTSDDFYGALTKKEKELKTFFRNGKKKQGQQKWSHTNYDGWLNLEKCSGGVTLAVAKSMNADAEWQIVSAFIGMLNRHFRDQLASVSIAYPDDD